MPRKRLTPEQSEPFHSLFTEFCENANRSGLDRRSWRDFYRLIIATHRRNRPVPLYRLRALLQEAEFSEYFRDRLSSVYETGWDLLECLPESEMRRWRREGAAKRRAERKAQRAPK